MQSFSFLKIRPAPFEISLSLFADDLILQSSIYFFPFSSSFLSAVANLFSGSIK